MKTYNILDKLQELNVEDGTSKRFDCIFCGKKNTLSVSKKKGKLLWNCFSASCGVKGNTGVDYSKEDLIKEIENTKEDEPFKHFIFPDYCVNVDRSDKAIKFMKHFGFYDVYMANPNYFMYDVKGDRLVFVVEHDGVVGGAVGRSLRGGMKWLRYDNNHAPFIMKTDSTTAIIVEDCVSACVVAKCFNGVALLGTNLLTEHIKYLKQFDKIWVALDRDATAKSLEIQRKVSIHVPKCCVKILDRDLKYENKDFIEELFK